MKTRKRRGIKKSGKYSYDLCPVCFHPNCDSGIPRPHKVNKRLREGLCPGCGQKKCKCKSKHK